MNRRELEHIHQQLEKIEADLANFIGDESLEDEEHFIAQAIDSIGDALDDLESLLLHF